MVGVAVSGSTDPLLPPEVRRVMQAQLGLDCLGKWDLRLCVRRGGMVGFSALLRARPWRDSGSAGARMCRARRWGEEADLPLMGPGPGRGWRAPGRWRLAAGSWGRGPHRPSEAAHAPSRCSPNTLLGACLTSRG